MSSSSSSSDSESAITEEQRREWRDRIKELNLNIAAIMVREEEKKAKIEAELQEIKKMTYEKLVGKKKEDTPAVVEGKVVRVQEKEVVKTENEQINENFAQIISILEHRISTDSEQLHDQRIRMLRRELTTKKKTIRLLETQNKQLEKEMKAQEEIFRLKEANLNIALDGKNQLVGRFGTDVSDYVKELIQDKKVLEDTVEKLEDQEEEYQEEIERLKEELKKEKEKNRQLENDLAEREKELEGLEVQLEKEEQKTETLKKEVDESKGHIEGLKELSSLKLIARFDTSQIHQLANLIAARETPQPQGSARTARCRTTYFEVLKENPDATKLMQLGDLVDLIWKDTSKEQIKKMLHNLREHQKYKDLDGWSNTEELEKLLAEKAVKVDDKEVVVPGIVTEIITEDKVVRAPVKHSTSALFIE